MAFVTGASGGIGRATAIAFAKEGAFLALLARSESRLQALADEIRENCQRDSLIFPIDLRAPADLEKATTRIIERFGRIDYLVNSAGMITYKPFPELGLEEFREMMAVNCLGAVACIRAVLPVMLRQRAGHIVNVASTAGRRGFPLETGYCASKFALVGFSEALRVELHGTGVGVSILCPGIVDTPMAAGFLSQPGIRDEVRPLAADQIASWVLRSIVEQRVEVILPFSTKAAIRLNSVAPRWVDWVIRRRAKRIADLISKKSSSQQAGR